MSNKSSLVYLSPVPWSSFSQRPHKFVEWYHQSTGAEVLWLDPYPTRFPCLNDLIQLNSRNPSISRPQPPWMTVIQSFALPIEPLPGAGFVNRMWWSRIITEISYFISQKEAIIVIGKPSLMALLILKKFDHCPSLYDAMDDFPAFYSGFSLLAMTEREKKVVLNVDMVWVSSTALKLRWIDVAKKLCLAFNGLDPSALPRNKIAKEGDGRLVYGYLGTIGKWFDWDWIYALAKIVPNSRIRLIGPLINAPTSRLPENVELLPPLEHSAALKAMLDFDVGLIPFKQENLTDSVDPIKYYEYRGLGLPVITTYFGEMRYRTKDDYVFISKSRLDIQHLVTTAIEAPINSEQVMKFVKANSWRSRFDGAILPSKITQN